MSKSKKTSKKKNQTQKTEICASEIKKKQDRKNNLKRYQYVLLEYPAQLIANNYWEVSTDGAKKGQFIASEEGGISKEENKKFHGFLKLRKVDTFVTTWICYPGLLLFCLLQAGYFAYHSQYVIAVAKLLGAIFMVASMDAWIKQLYEDVEFYGWAFGNYSQDVSLFEMFSRIKNKIKKKDGTPDAKHEIGDEEMIIADWLKNRPSIIFELVLMISLTWMAEFCPSLPFWALLCINIGAFELSFPFTSYVYLYSILPGEKKARGTIRKVVLTKILLFFVLFFLPLIIIQKNVGTYVSRMFFKNETFLLNGINQWDAIWSFLLIAGIALIIVLSLFILARYNESITNESDEKNYKRIWKKEVKDKLGIYNELSCKSQLCFLRTLLADAEKMNMIGFSKENISKLIDMAKGPQVTMLAQEVYDLYAEKNGNEKNQGASRASDTQTQEKAGKKRCIRS